MERGRLAKHVRAESIILEARMRRCPKCSLAFTDSARICRSCGAILDEVPDEAGVAIEVPAEEISEEYGENVEEHNELDPDWICPQCGESVPDTFAMCWSCNCQRPIDADLVTTPEAEPLSNPVAESVRPRHCSACGSTKIIPNATIVDQGQHSSGSLCVVVAGEPDALIFKDRLFGTLTADICGECGHASIRVHNPDELYIHYLRSRQ
jgi:hypothetical protein